MDTHEPLTPRQAAARIALAVRVGDPQKEARGRSELVEAKIAAAIERNLAASKPLSPAQVKRLSGLLRTGGAR